jgi:hemerythrin-like domain-containing protein
MPRIFDYLQIDHRNMRQLLRILDEELQAYDTRGSADFDLMKQIMEYTLHYPSLIHHPRHHMETEEEEFFPRLLTVFSDNEGRADFDGLVTRGYDPLFGTTIEKHCKALHQRILSINA